MARSSKATNQKRHAKRRAAERYGVDLHQDAYLQMIRAIQAGNAKLIKRQSVRCAIYEVSHKGQKLPVVYDRKRKTIVTVLPEAALTKGQIEE